MPNPNNQELPSNNPVRTFGISLGVAFAITCPALFGAPADSSGTPASAASWKPTVAFSAKESIDSNVFLQDVQPSSSINGAAPAHKESAVSTASAAFGLAYVGAANFNLAASYAPETTVFSSASSENFTAQKLGLNLGGSAGDAKWTLQNTGTFINGSDRGLIFGGPGGVPAIGGIPVRDRRDAFVDRSSFALTETFSGWFVRPVATGYVHNFLTGQSKAAGYENYIDRQEVIGGADFGWEVAAKTFLVAGLRYGEQQQGKLNGVDSTYDSVIRRMLLGIEGTPAPWLQLSVLGGPETRSWATGTPAGFARGKSLLWIDASASLKLGSRDTATVAAKRFEQPAFSSQSVYQDITYEATWRHKFCDSLALSAGGKAYGGCWEAPVNRDDWIYTPSASAQYAINSHCTAELGYSVDRARSRVPNTDGREFRRQLASIAAKYAF